MKKLLIGIAIIAALFAAKEYGAREYALDKSVNRYVRTFQPKVYERKMRKYAGAEKWQHHNRLMEEKRKHRIKSMGWKRRTKSKLNELKGATEIDRFVNKK